MLSCGFAGIALFIGDQMEILFSPVLGQWLGAGILIVLGLRQIWGAVFPKRTNSSVQAFNRSFRLLGLTIQIIREPVQGDLNRSGIIEPYEALLLGLSLSVDMLGAGIGISLSGSATLWLAPLVGITQSVCLAVGQQMGQRLRKSSWGNHFYGCIAGSMLCLLGIFRLF